MITYELALELKNAGFPQELSKDGFVIRMNGKFEQIIFSYYAKDFPGAIRCPTLSELIEACAPFERDFNDNDAFFKLEYLNGWSAGFYFYDIPEIDGEGETPDEAVARLWLELNSVDKNTVHVQ